MTCRKNMYKDMNRYHHTKMAQKKRYYGSTAYSKIICKDGLSTK